MRIPLDYYRILGLPSQATAEQLQQAHRDRTQQLPRREFSEAAISARKTLIDQAYALLSNPTERQDYDDGLLLAKPYDLPDGTDLESFSGDSAERRAASDPAEFGADSPSIELEESEFVGALLILLELGEYELVLRLGRPYLSNGSLSLKNGQFGEPEIVSADVVLTVALAYLELGREQWQQGQYENAATSLESGQELLLREGLFVNIRGEMQADLFKLRPYRILELVLLPDGQEERRRQGILLLEDMLHDRGGIDGSGDDLSGLSVDDFLRFIQQLRSYLTSAEQQVLFESEARRPSAVATYLAVYALLARGFAQRQPALIRRAKLLLLRLGSHQDVHLEQAVCSLLLGQTEEASRALELSQEFESLAFIREHSQTSPDLLPGLCLYSERWFQNEVFPHFRDLQQQPASLTDYFADEEVQLYLEELPAEAEVASRAYSATAQPQSRSELRPAAQIDSRSPSRELSRSAAAAERAHHVHSGSSNGQGNPTVGTAILDPQLNARSSPPAEAVALNGAAARADRSRSESPPADSHRTDSPRSEQARVSRQNPPEAQRQATARPPARRPGLPANLRLDRILLLAALGLLGVMLLGFLFGKLINRPQPTSSANAVDNPDAGNAPGSLRGIEPAFSAFANRQAKTMSASSSAVTEETAPQIIQTWLDAKSAALGQSHQIEALDQILAEPVLAEQRTRAEAVKAENSYWKLTHSNVEILSVEPSPDSASSDPSADPSPDPSADPSAGNTDTAQDGSDPLGVELSPDAEGDAAATADAANQASIEASVSEKADFYNGGELDQAISYDSTVRVRYELVRQDDQWRIQSMSVLE